MSVAVQTIRLSTTAAASSSTTSPRPPPVLASNTTKAATNSIRSVTEAEAYHANSPIVSDHSLSGLDLLLEICSNTRILSHLISYLSWPETHSLSSASLSLRSVFLRTEIKDIVLARFIPEYGIALKQRDPRIWTDSISFDYSDLGLLMASRDLPLHHYPTHALSVLGTDLSLLPTLMSWEHSKRTYRLRQFALSHSRMVLMLQNLVHSTTELVSSEFHSNEDTEQRRAIDPKSKFNSIPKLQSPIYPQKGGPRELTFPKPLSYSPSSFTGSDSITRKSRPSSANGFGSSSSSATSSENGLAKLEDSGRQQRLRHSRKWGSEEVTSSPNPTSRLTKTKSSVLLGSSSTKSESRINNNSQISPVASSSSSLKRKSNRLSIFASVKSRSQAPLPKPEEEPESLRIYSGNWRKSRQSIISPSARASQHVLANGSTGSPYVQSTPPRNRESRIPAALPRTRSDSISAASYSQSCEQGLSPDSIVEGEDEELQPPRRRFVTESGDRRGSSSSPSPSSVGTSRYSSSSSLGSVVSIGQGNASSSPSRFAVRGSPLGIGGSASSVRTDSKSLMRVGRRRDVHDLMSATVRSRAPILRVFVPCSSLSSRTAKRAGSAWEEGETEEEDDIIAKIENELVDAGLWDHLSVGDVVCNLGYVPLEFGPERGRGRGWRKEDTESNHTGTEIDAQQDTEEGEGTRWLIYTGTQLAVYDPFSTVERDVLRMAMGSVPLRGEEILGLPSPFYFSHLTSIPTAPSAGVEVNTVLRLPVSLLTFLSVRNNEQVIMNTTGEGMGIERGEESVKYWLEETTVRVRSRAGYGMQGQGKGKYGYIAVRTHAWLVSFHVTAASSVNVGSGWAGEWVLQSEGTPEGRARLEEVVFGSGDRRRKTEREVVVEIVREKCRGGKLWLRLVCIHRSDDFLYPEDRLKLGFEENEGLDAEFGLMPEGNNGLWASLARSTEG